MLCRLDWYTIYPVEYLSVFSLLNVVRSELFLLPVQVVWISIWFVSIYGLSQYTPTWLGLLWSKRVPASATSAKVHIFQKWPKQITKYDVFFRVFECTWANIPYVIFNEKSKVTILNSEVNSKRKVLNQMVNLKAQTHQTDGQQSNIPVLFMHLIWACDPCRKWQLNLVL